MNTNYNRRAIGAVSVAIGVSWITTVISPFFARSTDRDTGVGFYSFLLSSLPLMVVPGVIAVVSGVVLYRKQCITSTKWVVGVYGIFLALFISSLLSDFFPDMLPERISLSAFLFLGMLCAMFVYAKSIPLILRLVGSSQPHRTSEVSQTALVFVAFQLWILVSDLFTEYAPKKEGFIHVLQGPWGVIGLIVPILLAVVAYRTASTHFNRSIQTEQGAAANP